MWNPTLLNDNPHMTSIFLTEIQIVTCNATNSSHLWPQSDHLSFPSTSKFSCHQIMKFSQRSFVDHLVPSTPQLGMYPLANNTCNKAANLLHQDLH